MSGFTKGPWVLQRSEDSDSIYVGSVDELGIMYSPVVTLHDEDNANLIAAAPDLYDALCHLRDQVAFLKGDDYDLVAMADKALAKARGEK